MRVIRVDDEPEHGVALGSILVSLLEPAEGKAKEFNRWYERDHFYAGCMTGETFFSGRRFVATRALKEMRYPRGSEIVSDASKGSFLALYWMERGHHEQAEAWSVERVLDLGANGRMMPGRSAVHASFYAHRYAACRDDDGVPPEIALEHLFGGVVMVLSQRPEGVSAEEREAWMLETHLPKMLAGSKIALCLSLEQLQLPEASPVYSPPPPGFDRRHLDLYFVESDVSSAAAASRLWEDKFVPFGAAQEAAGMGEVGFASAFIPTVPGTDRFVDEV